MIFPRYSALLALLFLVSSCQKDEAKEEIVAHSYESESRIISVEEWLDFKAEITGEPRAKSDEHTNELTVDEAMCRCAYELVSFERTNPSNLPVDFGFFFTDSTCPDAEDCQYFNARISSGPPATCGCPLCGDCDEVLTDYTGGYAFNCDIPRHSSFKVYFGSKASDNLCEDFENYAGTATLKFRISCVEQFASKGCNIKGDALQLFSSGVFEIELNNNTITTESLPVFLTGCGCDPHTLTLSP